MFKRAFVGEMTKEAIAGALIGKLIKGTALAGWKVLKNPMKSLSVASTGWIAHDNVLKPPRLPQRGLSVKNPF